MAGGSRIYCGERPWKWLPSSLSLISSSSFPYHFSRSPTLTFSALPYGPTQGCGLGLETYQRLVSVFSRYVNVSSRLVKPTSRSREVSVSVSSRSRAFTSCAIPGPTCPFPAIFPALPCPPTAKWSHIVLVCLRVRCKLSQRGSMETRPQPHFCDIRRPGNVFNVNYVFI